MWTVPLIAALATGLIPILFVYLGKVILQRFGGKQTGKIQSFVSSFCAGALLSDVFGHLLSSDHSHSHGEHEHHGHSHGHSNTLVVLAGFAASFAFELFPFAGHGCHSHSPKKGHQHHHASTIQLASLIHCFTDGLTIAAAFLKSEEIGYSTCYAMLLHEIPHRLRDLLVLHLSPLQLAVQLSCSLLAASLTLSFGAHFGSAVDLLLPFSAGGFIYLAASSLVPEVREGPGSALIKLISFSLGILLI